jgi:hypothetical protein
VTTWATSQDVERAAENWTSNQKQCRVYGHSWRPLTVRHRPGVYTVLQRCERCSNERKQQVNDAGYPIDGWTMSYFDGYLLKALGRVGVDGRAVLRLDVLMDLPIEEEPD